MITYVDIARNIGHTNQSVALRCLPHLSELLSCQQAREALVPIGVVNNDGCIWSNLQQKGKKNNLRVS